MDELERKEKFLENDPAIHVWKMKLRRGWASREEYEEAVERRYRRRMKTLGLDPDGEPPVFPIPEDFGDPECGILAGYPVHEDVEMPGLYLPIEEFTQCHVGVWGRTRYGKTFLLSNLIRVVSENEPSRCFVCYDTQGELHGILGNLLPHEKLLYVPFRDYWKNPLQDVYTHGLDEALGNLKRALMESQFIGAQPVNLLEKVIRRRCTAEKLGALGPPSVKEILYNIRKLEEERGKGRGAWGKGMEYLHSLINILENLSQNLNPACNREISKGFSFRDFEGRVAVIDISPIRDPISLKFFVTKEMLDISLFAEGTHSPTTILLDETHRFAPLQKQYGAYSSAALVEGVKTSLKKGINYWMAEQNPGQFVDPAILANVGSHFAFRLPSVKDRWPVAYAMNISEREQADMLGSLEKMHCLVYTDYLGAAVLIKTPNIDIQDLREEASKRSLPLIKTFHERFLAERPSGRKVSGRETIPGQCEDEQPQRPRAVQDLTKKRIGEHRAKFPLSGITETYLEVGISPEIGKKHLTEMLGVGWLEGPERMPAQGKGHKTRDCYILTEKGCESLGLEWQKARLPGKGSAKSRLAAKMIGSHLERKGGLIRYEYTLGSGEVTKAADVAVLEMNGEVTAYEYQDTNSHLVENLRRNAMAGFRHTVVVCPNKRALGMAKRTAELEPGLLKTTEFATLKEFAG